MVTARDAATAERERRIAWEKEQEAKATQKQAEMERQILNMRQELSMLKAYISMHPNMAPPAELQQQEYVQTIPITARIEPASPAMDPAPSPQPPMSPISPVPYYPPVQQPMFVEGSSSQPLVAPVAEAATPPAPPPSTISLLGPPTPQSSGPSPSPVHTPVPQPNSLKRTRLVLEDESDYDSDTEEDSDSPPTDRALRRKNGHDGRCLTIHVRLHVPCMCQYVMLTALAARCPHTHSQNDEAETRRRPPGKRVRGRAHLSRRSGPLRLGQNDEAVDHERDHEAADPRRPEDEPEQVQACS